MFFPLFRLIDHLLWLSGGVPTPRLETTAVNRMWVTWLSFGLNSVPPLVQLSVLVLER